MVCPRCGLANAQGAPACLRCGLAFAPDSPTGPAAPGLRRASYSSPLGRGAEPVEAVWREEPTADRPAANDAAPADAPAPPTPSSSPVAPANRAPTPEERRADGSTPHGVVTQAPGALDDDPPPWLATALRAQERLPGDSAPAQPSPTQRRPDDSSQAHNAVQQPPTSGQPLPSPGSGWQGSNAANGANSANGGLGSARLVPPSPQQQPAQRLTPQAPQAPQAPGQPIPPPMSSRPIGRLGQMGQIPPTAGGQLGRPTPFSALPLASGQMGRRGPNGPNSGAPGMTTPQRPESGAPPPVPSDAALRSGQLGPAGRMPDPWLSGLAPSDPYRGAPRPDSRPNSLPNPRPNSPPGSFPSERAGGAPGWPGGMQSGAPGASGPGSSALGTGQPRLANVRPSPSLAPVALTTAQPPLPMGALLKGGRYRLLQRFLADSQLRPPAGEPPLLIASDADAPGTRVLIQELPLPSTANGPRESAEFMRQTVVGRLFAFAPDAHIPSLLDSFGERGRQFLVFESPAGDLLSDRLARARGPVPEREVVEYALRTLDALIALENGRPPLTHGALCPAHIILRPSGAVTLIGFSPALLVAPPALSGGIITVGAPSGVAGYAAPEQERGQASPRSDIYALGAIMSYAATGVALSQQPGAMPQPVRRLNPNLSLEFEEAVGRAMRASAGQRFQSAAEMRRTLQAIGSRGRTSLPDLTAADGSATRDATSAQASLTAGATSQRRPRNLFFIFGLVVTLIALIVGVAVTVLTHQGAPGGSPGNSSTISTPNPSAALYQQKGIGVSSGEFVFDFGGADASDKQQAVRALAAGDLHQAYTDYLQALTVSPNDAEAAIYAENLAITINHFPYVTIAVGVAFDGETAMAGATGQDILARDQLQGAFQAQENTNTSHLLPGGEHVQVLIVNSGPSPADAGAVAQALATQIRGGNQRHIIGLVSWSGAGQAQAAAAALSGTDLPILGTAIGVDGLTSAGAADYFAIVPTLSQQGGELANAAAQQLNATHILVAVNPQDANSMAMAQGFEQQIAYLQQHQIAFATITSVQNFTSGSASSYANVAQQAITQGDSLVFLSGADQDALGLAEAARHLKASYHILVGAQADTPALLGLGTDPLAQLARQNTAALAMLYVTTFANASEAIAVNAANSAQASFEANYLGVFGHTAVPSGLPDPDPQTLLAYDAATTLLTAAAPHDLGTAVYPTLAQMRASLLANNSHQGFAGVSGQITFGPDGSQPQKAMAILALTPSGASSSSAPPVTISLLVVIGGASMYCGSSGCGP